MQRVVYLELSRNLEGARVAVVIPADSAVTLGRPTWRQSEQPC